MQAQRHRIQGGLGFYGDEGFRELCNDLALADQAVAAADQLPEDIRADCVAKCKEWVESLEKEIAWELNKAKSSSSEG